MLMRRSSGAARPKDNATIKISRQRYGIWMGIGVMTTPKGDLRPRKHSLTLKGHRTSVSLEDPFWTAFVEIAAIRQMSISALASEIDAARGLDCGLASAIRVHVLNHYRHQAAGHEAE